MVTPVFKINGVAIKAPTDFTIEFQPITEAERLENGDMKITGVTGKFKGVLNYNFITAEELEKILGYTWDSFISTKKITQTFTFSLINGQKTIKSYFSPFTIKVTPESLANGGYSDMQISFIEL